MMTTEETAWDSLSYAGKNHILFERQKHLLEEFLVRNAISREQYEKKTMDEGISASFLNEWNGSRNHREKIYAFIPFAVWKRLFSFLAEAEETYGLFLIAKWLECG